ncbi:MAG: serine protease [Verrucomicrobiota bacterium]
MARHLGLLAVFSLGAAAAMADDVSTGDQLESLETRSGRKFEQVTIREILPDGVKIMHSSGTATIPAADLPQFASSFSGLKAPKPPEPQAAPESAIAAEQAWMPSSPREIASCSLFVNVSKGIGSNGAQVAWAGTAFLCNQGPVTYIYSNAHNFNGAVDFTITDQSGTTYDDFVSVEIASDGSGFWKETGLGGDIIRIRLKGFREKALTMDRLPLTAESAKARAILVTGNTGGLGKITLLNGRITDLASNQIIKHNAATEQGNSGSPIVDLESKKVIGILTWGGRLPEALQAIWVKKPEEQREGFKSGAALATVTFVPSSFDQLKNQQIALNQLMKNVRLFGLLDTLVPTKQGLFLDKSAVVMGEYTVEDLLAESINHPVVAQLVALDRFLTSKSTGSIGINNQDMLKRYIATYQKCLGIISTQRRSIENTEAATFFMKCRLKQTRLIEVCKAYETLSNKTLAWYVRQRGTGGQALPVASRFRLPAMRSGLNGLGLKE